MSMKFYHLPLVAGVCAFILSVSVSSAQIAWDAAGETAYADGWQGVNPSTTETAGTDNGGYGFLPWDFEGTPWTSDESPYPSPHFIDGVTVATTAFNNLGAPAFALTNSNHSQNNDAAFATRMFAQNMQVGQTFSVDIDNPIINPVSNSNGGGFIVKMLDSNKIERLALFTYNGSGFNDDDWIVSHNTGTTPTGFLDSDGDAGFNLAITLTGQESYDLVITPSGGGTPLLFTGAFQGTAAADIAGVQFVLYGNGSGSGGNNPTANGSREFYFNNLVLTPEPSSMLLFVGAAAGILSRRRK